MNRRHFLAASTAAAGLGALAGTSKAADGEPAANREFYELRFYHLRRGPKTELFENFYRDAAIPALNRAGVERVGVFSVAVGSDSPGMQVVLAHKSLDSIVKTPELMQADAEYQKAGAAFINAPASDPSFIRAESCLLAAFPGMPKLEAWPSGGAKAGLYELRTYESHNKKACKKKIEMFERGEIAIFRRCGLRPVFFGERLIGNSLPCLTYMLAYENMAAREAAWSAFGADPDWKKLRSTPGYTDAEIVSNISNTLLRPAAYSQI